MDIEYISIIISVVSLVVASSSLYLVWKRYTASNDWNRRIATHNTLMDLTSGTHSERMDALVTLVGRDSLISGSYADIANSLEKGELEKLNKTINEILNTYTLLSLHIKNHVLDDQLAYHHLAYKFVNFYRWCESYINEVRNKANERFLFIDFENLVADWQEEIILNANRYRASQEKARKIKSRL